MGCKCTITHQHQARDIFSLFKHVVSDMSVDCRLHHKAFRTTEQ